MIVRTYGDRGPAVIVLHGGPGAPGHVAPVARGLADAFRVLEPFQRRSWDGDAQGRAPNEGNAAQAVLPGEGLTVARHVSDLHEIIATCCLGENPALVGWSWGAMLALAYGAAHPERCGPLVLIGCGTFDMQARAKMKTLIDERMEGETRQRMANLERDFPDPDARLGEMGRLMDSTYGWDTCEPEMDENTARQNGCDERCDAQGYREAWNDMLRLQSDGVYPAAFSAIRAPVLMLHGSYDPHPGAMIRDSLLPCLPQIEYVEWQRCGHSPWMERAVKPEFFRTLRQWLLRQMTA